jgi:hypothetical protein
MPDLILLDTPRLDMNVMKYKTEAFKADEVSKSRARGIPQFESPATVGYFPEYTCF